MVTVFMTTWVTCLKASCNSWPFPTQISGYKFLKHRILCSRWFDTVFKPGARIYHIAQLIFFLFGPPWSVCSSNSPSKMAVCEKCTMFILKITRNFTIEYFCVHGVSHTSLDGNKISHPHFYPGKISMVHITPNVKVAYHIVYISVMIVLW